MADLVFNLVLCSYSRCVTAADDDNLAVLCAFNCSVEHRFGALGKVVKLEDTGWTIVSLARPNHESD